MPFHRIILDLMMGISQFLISYNVLYKVIKELKKVDIWVWIAWIDRSNLPSLCYLTKSNNRIQVIGLHQGNF